MEQTLELNFTIQNLAKANRRCFIFGSNVTNRVNLNQVEITPDFGVSYDQVLVDTQISPFTIGEIRMQSSSIAQGEQTTITVLSQNIYGDIQRRALIVESSENQIFLEIIKLKKEINMTGLVGLSFTVLAETTVVFTVYIKKLMALPVKFGNEVTSRNNDMITSYPLAKDYKTLQIQK